MAVGTLAIVIFGAAVLLVVVGLPVCALLGRWVAREKGRGHAEGFWLGLTLGPVGVLIEFLLPDVEPPDWDDAEARRAWLQDFEVKDRRWLG